MIDWLIICCKIVVLGFINKALLKILVETHTHNINQDFLFYSKWPLRPSSKKSCGLNKRIRVCLPGKSEINC